jgi:hypothetical protein
MAEALELLSDVVDRLEPLGNMSHGEPLRAAEWNAVVAAVALLARLTAARERATRDTLTGRFAPVGHDHVGEVAIDWLDPPTRALVEERSAIVEVRAQIADFGRQLAELRRQMKAVQTQVDGLRLGFEAIRDNDAAREKRLFAVDRRIEGMRTLQDQVSFVETRFAGLDRELQAALTFREELRDESGAAIDVRAINQRLGAVEEAQRNLVTADGEMLRAREFESRLARLESDRIAEGELDGLIADRLRDSGVLERAAFFERVDERLDARLGDRFETLDARHEALAGELADTRTRLDTQEAARAADVGRIVAAEGRLDALVPLGQQVSTLQARVQALEPAVQANTAAVAGVPGLADRVTEFQGRLAGLETLAPRLDGIEASVGGLGARVGAAEGLAQEAAGVAGRVAAIEGQVGDLAGSVRQLESGVARLDQFDQRVTVVEAQMDDLAALPRQVDDLQRRQAETTAWRLTVDERLAGREGVVIGEVVTRLERVEELTAENNASLRRLDTSVTRLDRDVAATRALAPELEAMTLRLGTIESRIFR